MSVDARARRAARHDGDGAGQTITGPGAGTARRARADVRWRLATRRRSAAASPERATTGS
ncbi:hypothetical protein FKV25_14915 [Lysobacter aestuarii]|uniref:Uncharacterized protein n=1 Tax=Marilutibacter aestuarii TaxID=1706195 RepID=A0A507ZYU8_9GAMM|nr:hypothetical protein FKV25_14915 [Lysobacter aestuarii]